MTTHSQLTMTPVNLMNGSYHIGHEISLMRNTNITSRLSFAYINSNDKILLSKTKQHNRKTH